jgi:hypothetical protein
MAHFAQLDADNTVTQVIVISNADITNDDGIEQETLGISICESVAGAGPWVQTSYNGNFRRQYAAIGNKYDSTLDVFYNVNPPADGNQYSWDEESLTWVPVPLEEPDPQE